MGVDSREIFRGKLRARCIIGGRETSVIYHKLRELLAQKTRLGELTRNAVYRFIELFIKWGNEAIGGSRPSSLAPTRYLTRRCPLTNYLSDRANSINALLTRRDRTFENSFPFVSRFSVYRRYVSRQFYPLLPG